MPPRKPASPARRSARIADFAFGGPDGGQSPEALPSRVKRGREDVPQQPTQTPDEESFSLVDPPIGTVETPELATNVRIYHDKKISKRKRYVNTETPADKRKESAADGTVAEFTSSPSKKPKRECIICLEHAVVTAWPCHEEHMFISDRPGAPLRLLTESEVGLPQEVLLGTYEPSQFSDSDHEGIDGPGFLDALGMDDGNWEIMVEDGDDIDEYMALLLR
ncbi:hypothetical protein HDU93_009250 [Gonapodya sp. JEL0774]|nr:hypothetical protein HDU93_009250 [Gonapodya sp. JEL0774]